MGSNTFFEYPQTPAGTAEEQLRGMYSYLYQMSEKLNEAMYTIDVGNLEPALQKTITQLPSSETRTKEVETLKSMIIKTANIVRSEMEEIRTVLQSEYTALSEDFGEYSRNLEATITATAEGILQEYNYDERITANGQNLERYQRKISQFIFSGLVDETNMKYGIAIGENITSTDAQGNESLNTANRAATFTMDELAFFIGGVKVAYISNNVFHIERGEILKSLQIGNHQWKVLADGSIALVKV